MGCNLGPRRCVSRNWISGTRSAVYSTNSSGPRTEPYGTPNAMLSYEDWDPKVTTRCRRPVIYELIHVSGTPLIYCTTRADDAVICDALPCQMPLTGPVRWVPPHHLDQVQSECQRTLLPLRTPSSDICGNLTGRSAAYRCVCDVPAVPARWLAPTALRWLTGWK